MMEIAPTTLEGGRPKSDRADTTVSKRNEEFGIRFGRNVMGPCFLGALVQLTYRDRPYHRHTALALDREAGICSYAMASSVGRTQKPQDGPAEAGSSRVAARAIISMAVLSIMGDPMLTPLSKMLPTRRATRTTPATTTTPTTTVTEAQLQALIDQGVAAASCRLRLCMLERDG
ncbi:hypothetical protein Tco_0588165 [Tanacetum coccineum]